MKCFTALCCVTLVVSALRSAISRGDWARRRCLQTSPQPCLTRNCGMRHHSQSTMCATLVRAHAGKELREAAGAEEYR